MFDYKSGRYSRRLHGAFVILALVAALGLALGLGLSGAIKSPPEFSHNY